MIDKEPNKNFIFQSSNGSGKTCAFVIPAVMRVDVTVNECQVLIIANTRELIRQIMQLTQIIVQGTGIKVIIGEPKVDLKSHIIVATPGFIKRQL